MHSIRVFFVFSLLILLVFTGTAMASQCLYCHSAMQGKMEGRKGTVVNLQVDATRFTAGVHGGFDCTECHINYSSGTHKSSPDSAVTPEVSALVPFTSFKSKSDPVALAACVKCHPDVYNAYKGSVHGKNIFEKKEKDGPLCLDCHGSPHYIVKSSDPASMVNHANVVQTCGRCHEEREIADKYKFSSHVIEKYNESFHGKKYMLGHKKVPVCSSCHGTHAITKWNAPDSPTFGQGKVKTCGKCHIGATEKFAAAPAHKYIGKENPIPYYGEKLLIVLLLGTFAFIVSHVIIEAISEIRDHYLKKEDKH